MSEDNNQEKPNDLLPEDTSTKVDMTAALEEITARMNENMARMQDVTNAQISSLAASMQQTKQSDQEDVDIYSDPDAYIAKIVARETAKVREEVQRSQQSQQATSAAIASASRDYPELNDPNSDFYKAADKEFKNIPASLKGTAEGIEMAVLRAAASTGLQPKGRRKSDDSNDFSVSGKSSAGKKSKKQNDEVSDVTKAWSKLLGRDVDSEDYKKSISEAASRDYKRYK